MKFALSCAVLSISLLVVGCSAAPSSPVQPEEPVIPAYNCPAKKTAVDGTLSVQTGTPGGQGWNAPHVKGKLLMVNPTEMTAQGIRVLQGLQVSAVTPQLQVVATPADKTDRGLAQELTQAGLSVQPDYLYQPLAVTNDPGFPGNAGISVFGTVQTQTYLSRIRIPEAWDVLARHKLALNGALTAVLDTAVDASHPELQGRILLNVSHVKTLETGDSHTCDHGTAAAGIIGATGNNGLGLSGTGQKQALIAAEVMTADGATTSAVATALYHAVNHGAKVINISFGSPSNPGDAALDHALTSAAKSAVIVAAAGNKPIDVYYPASEPSVIAVGAVGSKDDVLAPYSARPSDAKKRQLDVVAPGGDNDAFLLTLAPQGGYTTTGGTSFAAPQVAGVAALMRAANPALSAAQTRTLLLSKVNKGSGLPMLDAAAAVTGAMTGK